MENYKGIIDNKGVFVIAELGVNYYDIAEKRNISLLESAKLMIRKAKEGGADAVKFQSYKAERLASIDSPAYWDTNEEHINSQYELFKKFDKFEKIEYKKLSNYCRDQKILFLSTPFDFDAVEYLNDLVPIFKISSSDITNLPLIKRIAKKKKPIFLSTGAATIGEIEDAIRVINSKGNNEICIMHCILSYPTDYNDVNLNMIKHLKKVFPSYQIGYSDHAKPDLSMLITTTAYILGAKVIEKHFTLDKTLEGNDHYHAMDLNDLKKLCENIQLINKIKGRFHKKPLKCEKNSRKYARRSIVINEDIKKGEIITSEKISFKRPGTGIPPTRINEIIGGKALVDLKKDELLEYNKIQLRSIN